MEVAARCFYKETIFYIGVTETFLVCNELVFIFQNEKRNQGCFLDNPDATSHVSQALDAKTVWLIYVFS